MTSMIGMMKLEQWRRRAKQLKAETHALYLVYRDARVPWYAKVFAAIVLGYAFSPIDLGQILSPFWGMWMTSSWFRWALALH